MSNPKSKGNPAWKKGVSGNPGGKPVGARNTISSDFLKAMSESFAKNGKKAIQAMLEADPTRYCQIVASLVPKEMELNVGSSLSKLLAGLDEAEEALARIADATPAAPVAEGCEEVRH